MKKLLGILGTITIAGSGISGIIGNAPIRIEENNNLQNLIRVKRGNDNKFECIYDYGSKPYMLWAKFSHDTWVSTQFLHNNQTQIEFRNSLRLNLKNFDRERKGWDAGKNNYYCNFDDNDFNTVTEVIINNFSAIDNVFKNKNNNNFGLIIKTDVNKKYYGTFANDWIG